MIVDSLLLYIHTGIYEILKTVLIIFMFIDNVPKFYKNKASKNLP